MTRIKLHAPSGRLVGQFSLIVIGVLVALMVDAWIEHRRDEELKGQYLERLDNDLRTDLENIDNRTRFYTDVRRGRTNVEGITKRCRADAGRCSRRFTRSFACR